MKAALLEAALFALVVSACQAPADPLDGSCTAEGQQDYFLDLDGDGYGTAEGTLAACTPPDGYAASAGDCDDADASIHPGAEELCNGQDDDCDGAADPGEITTWYADKDGDGHGDPDVAVEACFTPSGFVHDGTDCDDTDPDVHPGAPEVCDGDDDDCDGRADQGEVERWYVDADGDGFGDPETGEWSCDPASGWVLDGTDCDDTDAEVSPAALEACNAVDDDCDGEVDEDFDEDGDGFGGASCGGEDCDDNDPAIHPDADEICDDGVDDDCDGHDLPCGLSGDYDLRAADGELYVTSLGYELANRIVVGDTDGQGGDDVLISNYRANTMLGGGYLITGTFTGAQDVEDASYAIEGVRYSAGAGRSIDLGDTNGDGIDDLLFGAPYGKVATTYVVLGPVTADTDLDDAVGVLEEYQYSYCGHGAELADVNDDGFADAVVGCYGDDSAGTGSGTVTVTYGPVTASASVLDDADVVLEGPEEISAAGQYLRAGMDLNGDGVGDIMSSSYANDYVYCGGTVFISHGPVSGSTSLLDADAQLIGEAASDFVGFGMAHGDLDGDGQSDAVVGSFGHSAGSYAGAAYVVYGPISGELALSEADAIVRGSAPDQWAGFSLAIGDIEGDGVGELVVGAPCDDTTAQNSGAAYLFLGPLSGSYSTADAEAAFWGEEMNDRAGHGLAFADTDNDGFQELLIGAPEHGTPVGRGGALYLIQPEF